VIDFSGTTVNGKPEAQYVEAETKVRATDEEKTTWLKEWNEDLRTRAYEKFTHHFNLEKSENAFSVGDYPSAEYTMTVKVVNITTGYFAGPMGRPSVLYTKISIVKKGESTPIATTEYKKISSPMSYTLPVLTERIAMSFGKNGEHFAKVINGHLK